MSSLEEHRKPTQIRRGVLIITIAHRRTHVLTVDLGRGTDFAPDFLHADRSDSHLQVGRKQSLEKNFFFFCFRAGFICKPQEEENTTERGVWCSAAITVRAFSFFAKQAFQ